MKKNIKAVLSIVFSILLMFSFVPTGISIKAAPVTSLTSGKTYNVKSYRSGLYLTAANTGTSGAVITQENYTGGSNQKWKLTQTGSYWLLSPQNYSTATYMNIYGGGTADGTYLKTWTGTDNASQWLISNYSSGVFSIRARENTTKAAVVRMGSYNPGMEIILYTFSGTTNELWQFEEVGGSSDDHGNSISSATSLNTSVTYSDNYYSGILHKTLNPMGFNEFGKIETGGDVDYFKFVPQYTSRYTFYSMGDADTMGTLYNSSGVSLISDDDSGSNLNFKITPSYNLIAGQIYYIKVSAYSDRTGSYSLRYMNVYADMDWLYPLADSTNDAKITWAYRDTDSGSVHGGMDIVGPTSESIKGQTLYAAQSGTIKKRVSEVTGGEAGNYIIVSTKDIDPYNGGFLYYIYEHMDTLPSYSEGSNIIIGNILGTVGKTGTSNSHLHFQVNTNDCYLSYRTGGYGSLDKNTTNPRKFYDHYIRFYSKSNEIEDLYMYPSSYNGNDYSQW